MKKIITVAAASITCGPLLLAARRGPTDLSYTSMKWEFPGGKLEAGEDAPAAIVREISEELDCAVAVESTLGRVVHEYPDFIIDMTLLHCRILPESQGPRLSEHSALQWVGADGLGSLDWAEADRRLLPAVEELLRNAR